MDEVPVGFGDVQGIKPGEPGGVVDQSVDVPEMGLDFGEEALDLGDLGQVGLKDGRAAAFLGSGAGFGL